MSAAEVIEQIKKLSDTEQRQVFDYLKDKSPRESQLQTATDAEFKTAAEKVFREHDALFRKLAQ